MEQLGTTIAWGGEVLDKCIAEYLASMLSITYNILRPYGIMVIETELLELIQVSAKCVSLVILVNKHLKAEILLSCSNNISFHVSQIKEREM